MHITKEIIAKARTLSKVALSNLQSITWSNIKGMALVANNVTKNALTVQIEEDDVKKELLKVIVVGDVVTTMADKVDASTNWLITTLVEEASFPESLIKHFCFLATGEVGGTFTRGTTVDGDDGVDEESDFLFWQVKGPLLMLLLPDHLPNH